MRFDRVWFIARLATLAGDDHGYVHDGAVAARDGRIAYAGPKGGLPTGWDAAERIDCNGRWITPGLVDCHTHLVFGGDRAHEFELRLKGGCFIIRQRDAGKMGHIGNVDFIAVSTGFIGVHTGDS